MAIDKSKKYWHGDNAKDVVDYLDIYSENEIDKTVIVKCKQCNSEIFSFRIDVEEGAIEVACVECSHTVLLLDSEDYWEVCEPKNAKCPGCNKNHFNIAVGFIHRKKAGFFNRKNNDVKWIYIGNRCIACGLLGSYGDWSIKYGPTDKMEKNV